MKIYEELNSEKYVDNHTKQYRDNICSIADRLMKMGRTDALQYFSVFMQGKMASAGVEV